MSRSVDLLKFAVAEGRRRIEAPDTVLTRAIFDCIESRIRAVEMEIHGKPAPKRKPCAGD